MSSLSSELLTVLKERDSFTNKIHFGSCIFFSLSTFQKLFFFFLKQQEQPQQKQNNTFSPPYHLPL